MKEQIFFMIKPDGLAKEREIMALITPLAQVVTEQYYAQAPLDKIEQLYEPHKNKDFYPWFFTYFKDKPIKAMILEKRNGVRYKEGFIPDIVAIVGSTDPKKAEKGTIRSLSQDDMSLSFQEGRIVKNLVHRSDNLEDARRELSIFFNGDYLS